MHGDGAGRAHEQGGFVHLQRFQILVLNAGGPGAVFCVMRNDITEMAAGDGTDGALLGSDILDQRSQ